MRLPAAHTTAKTGSRAAAAHAARMKTVRSKMRARLAAAQKKRALLIVHTGAGKGKSTAAFGMVARMLAHKRACAVIQFIKSSDDAVSTLLAGTGAGANLHWHHVGDGFTWDTQNREADIAQCRAGWRLALAYMRGPVPGLDHDHATDDELVRIPDVSLLVLDELNVVLDLGYLPLGEVLAALREHRAKHPSRHIVVTGRNAPAALIEMADLVTEMREIKHPFNAGVKAQAGIEF